MISPRTAGELSSPGSPRSSFRQMGAVFASHCRGLPVLSVTFQRWENSLKEVSVSFLSILGCSTSGSRDCKGLELPLLLSSLTPSWAHTCFPNIPTALASVYGFFICPHLLLSPSHTALGLRCSHKIPVTRESSQSISLHSWIALVFGRQCS